MKYQNSDAHIVIVKTFAQRSSNAEIKSPLGARKALQHADMTGSLTTVPLGRATLKLTGGPKIKSQRPASMRQGGELSKEEVPRRLENARNRCSRERIPGRQDPF
tara:strand:+ start:2950 stop:3264 length:315 start_codon:yes stop_codon:yes gene_type:complete